MGTKWKNIRSNTTTKVLLLIILGFCLYNACWQSINLLSHYDKEDMSISSIFADNLLEDTNTTYKYTRIIYALSDMFNSKCLWGKDLYLYDELGYSVANEGTVEYYVEGYNGKVLTNNKNLTKDDYNGMLFFIADDDPVLEMSSNHVVYTAPKGIKIGFNVLENAFFQRGYRELKFYEDGYKKDEFDINYDEDGNANDVSVKVKEISPFNQIDQNIENATIAKEQELPDLRIKKMYFKYTDKAAKEMMIKFHMHKKFMVTKFRNITLYLLVALLQIILLSMSAGHRKDKNGNLINGIVMTRLDKIYFEVYLAILIILISINWVVVLEFLNKFINYSSVQHNIENILTLSIGMPNMLLLYMGYISLVRRKKAGMFAKTSIIGSVLLGIKNFFSLLWTLINRESIPKTKTLFILDIAYVMISAVLAMLFIILMSVRGGYVGMFLIMSTELLVTFIFIRMSVKVHNEIDTMVDERLEQMLKSERTKTELITGVSHDLKTPITSIVAYIDLLKKEQLEGKTKEYVGILDKKADNLSEMVKDLFDIAKTASGEINLEMEEIDVNKLIQQTIADMQDRIDDSGFVIKSSYAEDNLIINSDGKKLYRVVQNLLDNAIKYSLKGSRIYVSTDLMDDVSNKVVNHMAKSFKNKMTYYFKGGAIDSNIGKNSSKNIVITLTNTASYEMDFDTEDIKQRFVRADKSRTEDGSGLGLAIASTYINALGGIFDIQIDGDQFKVMVML